MAVLATFASVSMPAVAQPAPAAGPRQPPERQRAMTPRQAEVAVVNAITDQAAGALVAGELRRALDRHPALRPLRAGDLARSLEEAAPVDDSAASALVVAQGALDAARSALARFDHVAALAAVADGEAALLAHPPSAASLRLLTELAFQDGLARHAAGDDAAAERSFAQVKRLDPARTALDPARYLPRIVKAFATAGTSAERGNIEVASPFDGAVVYVDGAPSGTTPAVVSVLAGVHYVTATLDDHRVYGERIEVAAGASVAATLRFDALAADERALGLRRRLAAGTIAPADAAPLLATLTLADDVVILLDGGEPGSGTLAIALYDGATATLTAPETLLFTATEIGEADADAIVAPLAPLPVVVGDDDDDDDGPGPVVPPLVDPPWYKKRWVQATIGGGLALTVIGIVAVVMTSGTDMVDHTGGAVFNE